MAQFVDLLHRSFVNFDLVMACCVAVAMIGRMPSPFGTCMSVILLGDLQGDSRWKDCVARYRHFCHSCASSELEHCGDQSVRTRYLEVSQSEVSIASLSA
jgi:hypothetical protein